MATRRIHKSPVVHICSFASAIGDMKRKDQSSDAKVLAVLAKHPVYSVFDATDNPKIAKTMDRLCDSGYITIDNDGLSYPWSKAVLTPKGIALVEQQQ